MIIFDSTFAGDTHNDARNMVHGPSTLLLWDGSTPGELTSHGAVDTANFNDMRKSLRSATLFPVLTTERSWTSLTDFQNEIDQPCLLPECLLGMPLAVSCASHDSVTAARLNGMKPGTWLRLRNLHIDKGAVETVYVSSSSSKTPPSAANTSSSSSSVSSGIAGDHSDISGSTRTHIVGTVRADTQISVLLPYFR